MDRSPPHRFAAAASTCGEREYCDSITKTCAPLPFTMTYPYGNCNGVAFSESIGYSGVQTVTTLTRGGAPYCGTCNGSQAVINPNNTDQATCPLFNPFACGASKAVCKNWQACFNGQCVTRASSLQNMFEYSAYALIRPSGIFTPQTISYQPNPLCRSSTSASDLLLGWQDYFSQITNSFAYCAHTAGVSTIAYKDISTPAGRLAICPGGLNQCTPEFCGELFANATKHQSSLYDATALYGGFFAECMSSYVFQDPTTMQAVRDPTLSSRVLATDTCTRNLLGNTAAMQTALFGCLGSVAQNLTVVDAETGVVSQGMVPAACEYSAQMFSAGHRVAAARAGAVAVALLASVAAALVW